MNTSTAIEIQAESYVHTVGKLVLLTIVLILPMATIFNKVFLGLSIFVALSWSFVNLYFLGALLREILDRGGTRRTLPFFLLVKFPVLYGAGYLLLRAGTVSVESLLVGLTIFLGFIFLAALKFNR